MQVLRFDQKPFPVDNFMTTPKNNILQTQDISQ